MGEQHDALGILWHFQHSFQADRTGGNVYKLFEHSYYLLLTLKFIRRRAGLCNRRRVDNQRSAKMPAIGKMHYPMCVDRFFVAWNKS